MRRGMKPAVLRLIVAIFVAGFALAFYSNAQAATGINSQVSFQGKLVNTNGTNLADGTYNLQFKIYQDGTNNGSGSTLKWTESRLVSGGNGVTVSNGIFQVNLGSITAFGGSIDWNQDTLWLSVNVGGTAGSPTWDGEMTPFIRLTSVPYALNAGMVGGLTASQLVQLSPGSAQSGNVNVTGSVTSGSLSVNTGTSAAAVINSGSSVPTADQFVVDNTSSTGVATAGVDGANIKYKGGAAAVEAAGMRIDMQPGSTSGGTWSGLRIVENSAGPATGITAYGVKLEGPTVDNGGQTEAVYIGSGWDIGLDIASGGIKLASQADPAAPATDTLLIYAKTIAGRVLPKWIGPSGVDTPFQASFGFNRISMLIPSGLATAAATTLFQQWGVTSTTSASTYTTPALATTNLATSVRKARLTSTGTAGAMVYNFSASTMAWRGNASGLGGFYYTTRFNLSTLQSGNRGFIGLTSSTAAPTNIDPVTATTAFGKLGVGFSANTGNLQWIGNAVSSAPTTSDLGANFPINTTNLYELIIFSPPNGSSITYRVKNLSSGSTTGDVSVSTNLPANTVFMAPTIWMTNNATAAAVSIGSAGWYLESDN